MPFEPNRAYLSKLKEMARNAREDIEKLAMMQLKMNNTLKQKESAHEVGDLFSMKSQFIDKLTELVESYETLIDATLEDSP